jgi:hypothetical protein
VKRAAPAVILGAVRAAYAHDAVLDMERDADLAAPGGAVTLALCGTFAHPPPCPVAPHHTRADRRADGVALRVLFAAEPASEAAVRAGIDAALAAGFCDGPDGTRTRWTLRTSAPGTVAETERAHAARLAAD